MTPGVRAACPADCEAIAAIYNQGIAEGIATFETKPRSPDAISAWFTAADLVSVAEVDGVVAAFAHLSEYRTRACYAGIREFSVYVDNAHRRTGLGVIVMRHLIAEASRAGLHKIIARIFAENTASLALCDQLGFRRVGTYEKHGRLNGVWHDCVIVELLLAPA